MVAPGPNGTVGPFGWAGWAAALCTRGAVPVLMTWFVTGFTLKVGAGGAVRSTCHVAVAALGSTLPNWSTACTENVCWPSPRPLRWSGELQAVAVAPSSEQRNVDPDSLEPNSMSGLAFESNCGGDCVIVVS